jgi:DNA-binding IclR family transcriptional regulator
VAIVDKALEVLKFLADSAEPYGVRELSRELGITKSSVQRLLASLHHAGYVAVEESTGKYQIGAGVLALAHRFSQESDLVSAAYGALLALRDETGESASVSTLVGSYRVTLVEVESRAPLRFAAGVGRPYSLLTGATARILLAQLPAAEVEALLDSQPPVAALPRTITDRKKFLARIQAAKKRGYEMSKEEWSIGALGLSVPLGTRDNVPAAASLYAPLSRLSEQDCQRLVPRMQAAAATISQLWRPDIRT